MKQPFLVSVTLPTYNRAYILKRAIDSVLFQTYKNIELVIIDDFSSDNTKEIVKSYKDKRIRYLQNIKNLGGAESRNVGIKVAKGDYIAFQDSDDEWLPNKLEKQMGILTTNSDEVGAIYCNLKREGGQKNTIYAPRTVQGYIYRELLCANFITLPSLIIKKQCLEKVGLFDPNLPRLQDWDLLLRLSKQYEIIYSDEVLLKTYFSKDSITAKSSAYTKALEMILDKYQQDFLQNKLYSTHLFNLANNLSFEECRVSKIRKHLFNAWRYNPLNLKYLIVFFVSLFGKRAYNFLLRKYKTFA